MQGEIENWNNGWYGVSLALSIADIDHLISQLTKLRGSPEQHFHITSDYSGSGGLGGIEICMAEAGAAHNLQIGSLALAPGSELPPVA